MKWAQIGVLGASLAIAACGGGDGTFGQTGGSQPAATLKIDNTNAQQAARITFQAVVDGSSIAGIGGAGFVADSPGGFQAATRAQDPSGLILDVVSYIPFGPEIEFCNGVDDTNGTITLSGDIAIPGTLTPGDTFRIEYDFCDEGFGEVIDGLIELTVVDFAGDLLNQSYLLAMGAVITDLQIATAADTITGNGDATVTLDTRQAPYIEAGVSGSILTIDSNTSSESLRNYSSDQTFDGNQVPAVYTLAAAGALETTQLAGNVIYGTGPDFVGLGENYPYTGVLLVEGDASSVRLVAVDDQNVRIEIDADGDGTFEGMIEMTWDEFAGAGGA